MIGIPSESATEVVYAYAEHLRAALHLEPPLRGSRAIALTEIMNMLISSGFPNFAEALSNCMGDIIELWYLVSST